MRKWKKVCAAALCAAMIFTVVEPAGAIMAKAEGNLVEFDAGTIEKWGLGSSTTQTVDAAGTSAVVANMPDPKYEMSLDGNLEVTGTAGATAQKATYKLGALGGDASYSGSGHRGSALNTNGAYGVVLDGVEVDSTYTVSAWVNFSENIRWPYPVMFVANEAGDSNWLGMAGANDNQELMLWYGQGNPWNPVLGNAGYELGTWTNYTLSVNGKEATLYANGKKVISGNGNNAEVTSGIKRMMFGVNYWDIIPNCLFDEVKIYDEALTGLQAHALYAGAGISLSRNVQNLRKGKTLEVNADVAGLKEGDTIVWLSSDEAIATVDENGIVTGVAKGDATITGSIMRDGNVIAQDTLTLSVFAAETGKLIADFTFDNEESGFCGAGAVATKERAGNNLNIVSDDVYGNVLQFSGAPLAGDLSYLSVAKEDQSSLLAGVTEFTVSYDSNSSGVFQNCWTFFANRAGVPAANTQYIGVADYPNHLTVERYKESADASGLVPGWKHVDVVFSESKTETYIDGVLRMSRSNSHTVAESLGSDSDVLIGASTWNNTTEYWAGLLDNYKIYDYALTAEEIAATQVSSVSVTSQTGSASVNIGETLQLTASLEPEAAANTAVVWSSSDDSIASVDQNGLLTPKAEGTVTITATAQDRDGRSGSIVIEVRSIQVTGITIECASAEMVVGNEQTLTAIVKPENATNKAVTWTTSNPAVATVSEKGLVTGVSAGTVTITAEAQDGSSVSGNIDLIVKKETFTVEAVSSDETMGTVSGAGTYDKGTEVTLIARENSGYKFVGWYDGDVLLTDRSYYTFVVGQDCSFTARFELDDIKVSSITVSSQNGANELMEGDTLQLNAEVFPENATNKAVIWKSPNPEYATVDENGLVTGVAESGTIYIMAEAQDGSGVSGSIALVVKKKTFTVEAVSADETMGTVSGGGTYDKGGQATLRATANSGYRFVGWYAGEDCVSETSVYTFTVDQNYSLTAKFKEITVGVKINANAAEAQIKVKAGDAPVQTGESYNGSVSQGVNVTVTAGDVAGYQFAYWKDLDTNKTVSDKKAYTFTAVYNVNLQAVYREEQAFTIIFKTNETFANKVLKEESVKESAPVDVPQPFEMAGYTFAGWDTTGDGTADVTADTTSVTVDKNQVWTAVYTVNEVLHLVQTWGGGTIVKVDGKANDSTSVSVKRDTLVTVKADAPASGQYFAGWSMDGGNTLVSTREEFSFFVKKDTTIYAVYSQNETKVSPTIAVSGVSRVRNSATGKDSVRIEVTWDVPEGFTAVNEGILRTYNDSLRNDLYIGKAGVTNNSCGKGYRNGTYAYSFNIGNTSANLVKNIHTVGYLVYKDAKGTVHTIYTEVETLHSNN